MCVCVVVVARAAVWCVCRVCCTENVSFTEYAQSSVLVCWWTCSHEFPPPYITRLHHSKVKLVVCGLFSSLSSHVVQLLVGGGGCVSNIFEALFAM